MSGEKLIASYVVRVSVKHGKPQIAVLDMSRGSTTLLGSYQELTRHLELAEAKSTLPDEPRPGGSGGDR